MLCIHVWIVSSTLRYVSCFTLDTHVVSHRVSIYTHAVYTNILSVCTIALASLEVSPCIYITYIKGIHHKLYTGYDEIIGMLANSSVHYHTGS